MRKNNQPVIKTSATLFAVLTGILIFASVMSYITISNLGESGDKVSHSNVVKYNLLEVLSDLKDAETGQRGYLLTRDSSFLEPYIGVESRINPLLKGLDTLVNDYPAQHKNLQKLKSIVSERLYLLQSTLNLSHRQHTDSVIRSSYFKSKLKMDEARNLVSVMLGEEDNVLKNRIKSKQKSFDFAPVYSLAVSILCIIFIFIAYAQTRKENNLRQLSNEELQQKNYDLEQQQDFVDAVFDASVDVMIVLNRDLTCRKVNNAIVEVHKKPQEEFSGKSLLELFPHIRKTGLHENLQRVLAGETIHQSEYYSPPVRKYFELFLLPLKDRNENIDSILLIAHDMTTVSEANKRLQQQNRQLEETNQELASFSYIASHDLKEPLRKIQIFTKRILETETFTEKAQNYFSRIIGASERMQNLIDSLLNFSLANNTSLEFVQCDLNEILKESTEYLDESIKEKQPVINAVKLPVVRGLPAQLIQLFINLIDNAIKYCRQDIRPVINIDFRIVKGDQIKSAFANKNNHYHQISFSDNGIGFEQQYEHKIFEIFQRLHARSEYTGTGIGLAICKKIVNNHNGFIVVKSKPDHGTTFIIYLPKA